MQRQMAANWLFIVSMISAGCVSALSGADVRAGDSEVTRKLISLVGSDEVVDEKDALTLYTSIAADSSFKPVASQSLALLQMRQGKYSEAWKLLSAQTTKLSSMPMPFRVGHEKLMLWLWLQAGSADQAESQFNKLVSAAVNKDLPDPERRDICYFVGGVIGMLQSSDDTSCVASTTLEQGRASLEKIESKISLEQFQIGLRSATAWKQALQARVDEFTQAEPAQAESILTGLKQTLEANSLERVDLLAELKRGKVDLNALNEEVKKLRKNQSLLIKAWNTPTPGKPSKPSPPREPIRPREEYETTYTTDSKTGKRTPTGQQETAASKARSRSYQSDMQRYYQKLRQYEIDAQTYPTRLAAWTQMDTIRRANLQANKKKIDEELSAKNPMLEKAQAEFKEKTATSKSLENEMRLSKVTIAIATIAKQRVDSKATKTSFVAKPSYFQLLDFDSEVFRLEKSLREMPRK